MVECAGAGSWHDITTGNCTGGLDAPLAHFARTALTCRLFRRRSLVSLGCLRVEACCHRLRPPAPYTVIEYYYKVQWGHQQEFLDLFLEESLPAAEEDRLYRPHDCCQSRSPCLPHHWKTAAGTIASTITYPTRTAAVTANPVEEALISSSIPISRHKREEQRRFEILFLHWDLPVTDITPAR